MTYTTFPGYYKIKQIVIYSAPNSENRIAKDIRSLVASVSIIESIDNDSIRGSIQVVDSAGLLEDYPIRGEERIYLELEDALKNIQRYYCFVYRIDNVEIADTSDKIFYTLQFVTYQRFLADTKKITTSYYDTVSKMVEDIFNRNYRESNSTRPAASSTVEEGDPNKQIIIENTEGYQKCIIPTFTPFQAIKFLESRAYSTNSVSCSFRFFERTNAFYFATDEYMHKLAVENNKIFEFTSSDYIPNSGDSFLRQMTNLKDIKNIERFDTFDDIHGGAYKNKVMVLDIVNRTTNITDPGYDYIDNRSNYYELSSGQQISDRHSDNFVRANLTEDTARKFIMVKDYVDDNSGQLRGEQFIPQIASNRLSYRKHLQSMKVTANGPGRFDITCGDFVNLLVPDYKVAGTQKQFNKQLSGVYMVETITRTLGADDKFTNSYVFIKRNWSEVSDSRVNEFLATGLGGL